MKAAAIIMSLIGIFLLYGGLACCIGIAWYHGRMLQKKLAKSEGT
jgi:hypothetical protein